MTDEQLELLSTKIVDKMIKLKSLEEWFSDTVSRNSEITSREVPSIENPSIVDRTSNLDSDKLGKYEKTIVDNYRTLLTNNGADTAEEYFASKRRYLPRGFHPRKFIGD